MGQTEIDPALIQTALQGVRKPLEHAQHLPGEIYTAPAVLAREMDRIFARDWLCVGRVEEIENPGDYIATRVLNEPILLMRAEDGSLGAFANLCRHRGVQLVEDGRGTLRGGASCPYHGWAYDLKGCLTAAPLMDRTAGFDRKSIRLLDLRLDTWEGWIFVTLNSQAAPLKEFVADFERDVGFLKMGRCRVAKTLVTTWNCNWKFVTENVCDPYHFRALHAKTLGNRIPVEQYTFDLRKQGGFGTYYEAAPQTPDGTTPMGPMPWLKDRPVGMSAFGFLAPNIVCIGRVDEVHVYTIWPEAVDRTRVMLYHLFAGEHFKRPDFDEKSRIYTDFLARVVGEDASVAPALQQAALSPNFRPGRLSWLEGGVHHQMKYAIERTFA